MANPLQQKAQDIMTRLQRMPIEEVHNMVRTYQGRIDKAKSRENPDDSAIQNFQWHLGLAQKEIARRGGNSGAQHSASGKQQPKQPTFQEAISELSKDELQKLMSQYQAEMDMLTNPDEPLYKKYNAQNREKWINTLKGRVTMLVVAIDKIQENDSKEKKSNASGSGFTVDKDYFIYGASVAALGAAIGWGLGKGGKTLAGYAVIGAAIGAGLTWASKQDFKKAKPKPNV